MSVHRFARIRKRPFRFAERRQREPRWRIVLHSLVLRPRQTCRVGIAPWRYPVPQSVGSPLWFWTPKFRGAEPGPEIAGRERRHANVKQLIFASDNACQSRWLIWASTQTPRVSAISAITSPGSKRAESTAGSSTICPLRGALRMNSETLAPVQFSRRLRRTDPKVQPGSPDRYPNAARRQSSLGFCFCQPLQSLELHFFGDGIVASGGDFELAATFVCRFPRDHSLVFQSVGSFGEFFGQTELRIGCQDGVAMFAQVLAIELRFDFFNRRRTLQSSSRFCMLVCVSKVHSYSFRTSS